MVSAATAKATFSLFAALSAPRAATCLDHEFVAATLGTAAQPAVLVEAIWLREDGRLVYVHRADSDVAGNARAMTCHLVAVDLHVTEIRAMMHALRADAAANCCMTYQEPLMRISRHFFHPRIATMTMICKVDAEGDSPAASDIK